MRLSPEEKSAVVDAIIHKNVSNDPFVKIALEKGVRLN
jgi:hypothetical protein